MNVASITHAFSQSNGIFILQTLWQLEISENNREFPDEHSIFYTKSQNRRYCKVKFRMNARGNYLQGTFL